MKKWGHAWHTLISIMIQFEEQWLILLDEFNYCKFDDVCFMYAIMYNEKLLNISVKK